MKPLSVFFFSLFFVFNYNTLGAQSDYKGFDNCTAYYFTNSDQKSAEICYDGNRNNGIARAFKSDGSVMETWQISRMHVLSSVQFTFHSNGAVHRATFSSHPDAGIQWYRSETTFDIEGNKTGFFEERHDDMVTSPHLHIEKHKAPTQKQEVMECAPIMISEFHLKNQTKKSLIIQWSTVQRDKASGSILLKPGKTIKIHDHYMAAIFQEPAQFYSIKIYRKNGIELKYTLIKPILKESPGQTNVRKYIYGISINK